MAIDYAFKLKTNNATLMWLSLDDFVVTTKRSVRTSIDINHISTLSISKFYLASLFSNLVGGSRCLNLRKWIIPTVTVLKGNGVSEMRYCGFHLD